MTRVQIITERPFPYILESNSDIDYLKPIFFAKNYKHSYEVASFSHDTISNLLCITTIEDGEPKIHLIDPENQDTQLEIPLQDPLLPTAIQAIASDPYRSIFYVGLINRTLVLKPQKPFLVALTHWAESAYLIFSQFTSLNNWQKNTKARRDTVQEEQETKRLRTK